jgi:hypothetical protein
MTKDIATLSAAHGTVRIVVRDWKHAHPYRVEWLEKGRRAWKCVDGCSTEVAAKKAAAEVFMNDKFSEEI